MCNPEDMYHTPQQLPAGGLKSHLVLRNVRLYAHHGVAEQEQRIGAWFTVTLRIGCDLTRAAVTDSIADTLNYADLYDVVRKEMQQPSKLLEHVAARIIAATAACFQQATSIYIELAKLNPPMGADCDGAGVTMEWQRDS